MDEEAKRVIINSYKKWLEDEKNLETKISKEEAQNIIKAIKRETQVYVEKLEKGMQITFQKIKNKRYK